jgi:hypothetical protein
VCVRLRRPGHVLHRHERGARIRANRCRGNVSKQPQLCRVARPSQARQKIGRW